MRGSLPGKFLLLPDWGELLLLAQELKRPTAGQLETTSRLWRKCRPTRVVFQPLPKMLCTYVAVRLRRTARLGGIAAASAGPQEGYRCHAYQDLGKFHRNFTSSFYGCRGWPTSEFSHVASNVRVAGDKENTFGQRSLILEPVYRAGASGCRPACAGYGFLVSTRPCGSIRRVNQCLARLSPFGVLAADVRNFTLAYCTQC
jgi:hypothetical protein